MLFVRLRSRVAVGLAALALLLSGLMPTLAQAMVAGERAPWLQVCSASGMVWVQADAGGLVSDAQTDGSVPSGGQSCPYCTLHGGAGGLPAVEPWAQRLIPAMELPRVFSHPAQARTAWASAQSRAPPTSP